MSKKSTATIDFIIFLAIGLFTVLVLAIIVPRLFGGTSTQASELLSSTRDYDGDGVADFFDKCACEQGDDRNDGCPSGKEVKGTAAKKQEEECRKKIRESYKT